MSIGKINNVSVINILLLIAIMLLISVLILKPPAADMEDGLRITNQSPDEIHRIEISRPGSANVVLEKDMSDTKQTYWKMISPVEIQANEFNVNRLLGLLKTASSKQFKARVDELVKYGLQPPDWQVRFNDKLILFGDVDPVRHLRYVAIDDNVYLLQDRYSQFSYDIPNTFISTRLVPEITGQLLAIRSNDSQLERNEQGWTFSSSTMGQRYSVNETELFVAKWRLAEAVRVTRVDSKKLASLPVIRNIDVLLDRKDSLPVTFTFIKSNDANLIINRNNLITYIVSEETFQQLMEPFKEDAGTT